MWGSVHFSFCTRLLERCRLCVCGWMLLIIGPDPVHSRGSHGRNLPPLTNMHQFVSVCVSVNCDVAYDTTVQRSPCGPFCACRFVRPQLNQLKQWLFPLHCFAPWTYAYLAPVSKDVCECKVVLAPRCRKSVVHLVSALVIDTLLHRGLIYGLISGRERFSSLRT